MRLLLDTHYLIWLIAFSKPLSTAEIALITSNEVLASAVSFWELRIKREALARAGRHQEIADPEQILGALLPWGISAMPLEPEQACAMLVDPIDHKDPFDVQLLIHAQTLGAKLLTRDTKLLLHPLAYRAR